MSSLFPEVFPKVTFSLGVEASLPCRRPALMKCSIHRTRSLSGGYRLSEIEDFPLGPEILRNVDVLIAGRYVDRQHVGQHLLGSANQRIDLLTNRYSLTQLKTVPRGELILHPDGSVTATGILPWNTNE